MRLINKFRVIVAIGAAGIVLLAGFWLTFERSRIVREKQEKARNLVETAYSALTHYQKLEAAGQVSREQAQAQALEVVGALRYEGENYFWINDLRPVMVMHPMKPQMNGKDLL